MPNSIELDFRIPDHKKNHLDARGEAGASLKAQLEAIPGVKSVDTQQPTGPGFDGRVILRIDPAEISAVQIAIRNMLECPDLEIKILDD